MATLAQRITWLVCAEQQLRQSLSGELLDHAPAPQAQPPTLRMRPTRILEIDSVDAGVVAYPQMAPDQSSYVSIEQAFYDMIFDYTI